MNTKSIFGVFVFYAIAIGLRYLTNETSFLIHIDSSFLKIILQAMGPAIGALVAVKIFDLKFSMSLKGMYNKTFIPLLIFWILPILIISGKSYIIKGEYPYLTVLAVLIYGFLEEIGWRGFLQEQLKSLPKTGSILIVATLWFIWHLNFEISIANLLFFIILIFGSWGIGVVANKTKSLLAVASFHSLNNFYSEWHTINISIIAVLCLVWILAIIYLKKQEKNALINGIDS